MVAGLAAMLALLPTVAAAWLDIGVVPGSEPTRVEMMPKSLNLRGQGKFTVLIEPGTPQGAMQINPGTVAIAADEPITLGLVEPLHGTFHFSYPPPFPMISTHKLERPAGRNKKPRDRP
jgi:hypothetical protein